MPHFLVFSNEENQAQTQYKTFRCIFQASSVLYLWYFREFGDPLLICSQFVIKGKTKLFDFQGRAQVVNKLIITTCVIKKFVMETFFYPSGFEFKVKIWYSERNSQTLTEILACCDCYSIVCFTSTEINELLLLA